MFHLAPVGQHTISVCHNISCALRGADEILSRVCSVTGATPHGTSPDGKFTVETVECQGACANAPMFDLDGTYYENLDPLQVDSILERVRAADPGRRFMSDRPRRICSNAAASRTPTRSRYRRATAATRPYARS